MIITQDIVYVKYKTEPTELRHPRTCSDLILSSVDKYKLDSRNKSDYDGEGRRSVGGSAILS